MPANDSLLIERIHVNTSVEGLDGNIRLEVYPNPFHNDLYLSLRDLQISDIRIEIFDLTGRKQYQKDFYQLTGNQVINLDLDHLPSGIFILKIKSGHLNSEKKLIKY